MRIFLLALLAAFLCFLPGCVDQKGQITQETKKDIKELVREALSSLPAPNINVPPNQTVDTSKLREDIRTDIHASADNNAAQMTGAVNTSVNKLANDITGVKVELGKLIDVNNNLYTTLNTNFMTSINTTAQANADFKTNIQALNKIMLEFQAKVEIVNQMSAQLNAQGGAIAGIANKVDNISNSAGRDVNMLPMSAVWMIIIIISVLAILAAVSISWAFKASRDREVMEAQEDREESRRLHALLLRALAMLPEKHAMAIARELGHPAIAAGGEDAQNQTPTP